jgi:hypothetical protein
MHTSPLPPPPPPPPPVTATDAIAAVAMGAAGPGLDRMFGEGTSALVFDLMRDQVGGPACDALGIPRNANVAAVSAAWRRWVADAEVTR